MTGERFRLLVDDAEAAWTRLDTAGFDATTGTLDAALPCLSEPTERALLARYHRLQGLRAFGVRDSTRARAAFAATRRLEPAAGLPTTFAPAGHPLQAEFEAVPIEAVTTERVPKAADGTVSFDATVGRDRPANVPSVFQWRDAAGRVRTTAYVWPQEPLPDYPTAKPGRARRTLLLGAAGGAVVAAGLTLTAALAADSYDDPANTCDDLRRLRPLVNASNAGAIGFAIAAGGTAVVAFVVPFGE
ncbi:MAG: hypothetical protein Q8P41_23095 [Pseudomonadota bacterium]|nr:hypothetical protein [Pseudomonadota bacterium]